MTTWIVFFVVGAYLGGSISSAILLCKAFGYPDPRTKGSENPGATNVLRVAGKPIASLVLVFDVLKGALPCYLAFIMGLSEFAIGLIAIAACIGHMYPIFFAFKGGKAVATALGAMLPMGWPLALALVCTWLLSYRVTRYSSVAALITVGLAPIYTYIYKAQFTLAVSMLSLLIVVKHRSNLIRLIKGQELKQTRLQQPHAEPAASDTEK
ncbi:glycerol-3-phosphate 1-O-acyltransferase PlsY [Glaciecola siphonariae]|uniref:Glycerol-3-phosphate acyltransferase n=1 Tax=Glaciecola siphonariae TaxID=521012 RepID=A0ABV9LXM9_9ALTE